MLGVNALIIDRNERVGDNWRQRYHQLVLHDPVWYDHLPYINFPAKYVYRRASLPLSEFSPVEVSHPNNANPDSAGPYLRQRTSSPNFSRLMQSCLSSMFGQARLSKNHTGTIRTANGQSFSSERRKMAQRKLALYTQSISFKPLATPARRNFPPIFQASPTSKAIDSAIHQNSLALT